LEAFAKFGSDLDDATKAIIEKGVRNVEILKQPQYNPVPVEKEIAIIFAGTKGLLMDIPREKIRDFEKEYLEYLDKNEKDLLDTLKKGTINEEIENKLTEIIKKLSLKYKK